jgi:hypothetical protein
MELILFTKKIYEYFAYTIYGKDMDWKLVNGKRSQDSIKDFTEHMLNKHGGGAGPSFIWLYVIFQFGRFELTNFRPTSHTNTILPLMIFGKGAIDKYESRKTIDALTLRSPWMQIYKLSQQEFVRKYGLTFTTSMEKVDRRKVEKILMSYRDPIKMVTSTTNQGMELCIDMTELYNEKDKSCQSCQYSIKCKKLLKETNINLFELRRYE